MATPKRRLKLFFWVFGVSISPGVVNIEDDCVVADVKCKIVKEMQEKFAADELILWKVSIPLSQQLKALVKECQLLDDTSLGEGKSLSEIFQLPDPAPDTLHIIAQVRQRHAEGSIVEELEHVRKHFWGHNRAIFTQSPTAELIDLSSINISRLNPLSVKILLVRKEYRIAYNTIIANSTKRAGRRSIFYMTGHPGIGKTFFLLYFLLRRLEEREPVAFQISAHQFAIFDQSGVHLYLIHAEETFSIPKGIWTLSDSSGKQQLEPCTAFQTSAAHLLHTSSPASDRWKDWVKQLNARRYIMDLWSRTELQTLLAVSNLDTTRGLTLFDQYGSNVRIILDILDEPSEEVSYLNNVQTAAAKVAREFSTSFQELLDLDFSSKDVSSKIFMLKPQDLDSRQPALTIPTTFLLMTLTLALCRSGEAQQHAVFAMLNSHSTLRIPAGWMFENMAHVVVANSQWPRLKIYNKANAEYSMPAPEEMTSGNSALRGIKQGFRPFYWRPRESNYEGVDAVLRSGDDVWALQYTVSRSHRAATEGLNEIRKNMNLKYKVRWHLVMIGATRSEAESARDSQRLTDPWNETPVYACALRLGIFNNQMLQQLQHVFEDDSDQQDVVMGDCL